MPKNQDPAADVELTEPNKEPSPAGKRWKARLVVSLIMLALAFVSLVILKIQYNAYWVFTCIMAAIDAILSIWLVWYVKRNDGSSFPGNMWHLILHWIGLIAVMYLIAVFINRGVISHAEAGLFALLILALTLYLAGIYTDTTFMLIGITLAILAAGTILVKAYLWLVMIPVIIVVALIIFVIVARDRRKTLTEEDEA